MTIHPSLLTENPVTAGFSDAEAERGKRVGRRAAEQGLESARAAAARSVTFDDASLAAVRASNGPNARGRSLNDITTTEFANRGLGREALDSAQRGNSARAESEASAAAADTANFDRFVDALAAGDGPSALLIAQQSGRQMTPAMQQAVSDVNFQQGVTRLWDQSKVIYKNQPRAMQQAMQQGMEQLMQSQAQGSTAPQGAFQGPPAAAVTPNITSGSNQIIRMADGTVVRVPRNGGPSSVVSDGRVDDFGNPIPLRTNTLGRDDVALNDLKAEGALRQLAEARAEGDPTSYTTNEINGGRERDPTAFATNVAKHFEVLRQQTGLGPPVVNFPSGNPDSFPNPPPVSTGVSNTAPFPIPDTSVPTPIPQIQQQPQQPLPPQAAQPQFPPPQQLQGIPQQQPAPVQQQPAPPPPMQVPPQQQQVAPQQVQAPPQQPQSFPAGLPPINLPSFPGQQGAAPPPQFQSPAGAVPQLVGQNANQGQIPRPQTPEDFQAVPVGGAFIDPEDGLLYIK